MSARDVFAVAHGTLLSGAHFGDDVTYTAAGFSPVAVRGAYTQLGLDAALAEVDVSTTIHRLLLRAADVPDGVRQGDAVTVLGTDFIVAKVEGTDDAGYVLLTLHLAADP